MDQRTRLGILLPSSNTVLEPLTAAMLAETGETTAHFARIGVTEITLSKRSRAQFAMDRMLSATDMLVDAHVDAIVWSGTSASWLGFDRDEAMCREITSRSGLPAGSAVLAINRLFRKSGVQRFGLVTPYGSGLQDRIVDNYANAGFDCVAERHLGGDDSFGYSLVPEKTLAEMILSVAQAKPDAVTVMCTNLRAARIVPELERQIGIPIFDSVAAAVWSGLHLAGGDASRIRGWGRLFELR